MGSHMEDEHGFLRGSKTSRVAYGGKTRASSSSHQKASERADPQATLRKKFTVPRPAEGQPSKAHVSGTSRGEIKAGTIKKEESSRPARTYLTSSDEEDDHSNDIKPTAYKSGSRNALAFKSDINAHRTQRDAKRASPKTDAAQTPPKAFKRWEVSKSPEAQEQPKTSPLPAAGSELDMPKKKFVRYSVTVSPEPEDRKKKFLKLKAINEDSPKEPKRTLKVSSMLSVAESSNIKRALKATGMYDDLDLSENKDIPLPKKFSIGNDNCSLSPQPSPSKRARSVKREKGMVDTQEAPVLLDSEETTCPMCRARVPLKLLMDFSSNRPTSLNTRQQASFCSHHQRSSALATYTSLGYPPIPWDALHAKLAPHFPYISSLITSPGTTLSHYRSLFASDITHGRNRTLKQSIMGDSGTGSSAGRVLIPGYYGPRGARAMQDAILLKFNRELRKAAVEDHVVSARAVGGYVASVLVPELGTRLIMDDLKIGEEEARAVMEKSAALGSLVNEEVKDVRTTSSGKAVVEGGDYD